MAAPSSRARRQPSRRQDGGRLGDRNLHSSQFDLGAMAAAAVLAWIVIVRPQFSATKFNSNFSMLIKPFWLRIRILNCLFVCAKTKFVSEILNSKAKKIPRSKTASDDNNNNKLPRRRGILASRRCFRSSIFNCTIRPFKGSTSREFEGCGFRHYNHKVHYGHTQRRRSRRLCHGQ